ncbi:MAG: hypothetical protein AAFQ98_23070 [Bacteroidota bacterium]
MSKERIDTLFRQGLEDHRTPPPSQLWDKLEEQLGEEEEEKRGFFILYRVAAAIIILVLVGWWGLSFDWKNQQGQLADTGESEEVQNLVATGESEEVQNLAKVEESTSVQSFALTGESEEVQNLQQNTQVAMAANSKDDTGESEEVQNLFVTGESEEVQNRVFAQTETIQPLQGIEAIQSISVSIELAPQQVFAAISEVPLIEIPAELIPSWNEIPEEIDFQQAVALAREMKQGEITLADLRNAKDGLGQDNPVTLASLRDAKNEFLTFSWIGDDD